MDLRQREADEIDEESGHSLDSHDPSFPLDVP